MSLVILLFLVGAQPSPVPRKHIAISSQNAMLMMINKYAIMETTFYALSGIIEWNLSIITAWCHQWVHLNVARASEIISPNLHNYGVDNDKLPFFDAL